ncbi:MAG: hypothetical protein ABWZ25_01085 [Chitinophagaceae bacterium]
MKKILFFSFVLVSLAACRDEDESADTDLNVATNFIQSALKGDFKKAEKYMVDDSLNKEDLATVARLNARLPKSEKDAYSGASIRIHDNRKINDSATVVTFSNSYRNKVDSLKVVRINGKWLVDFKYIFNHKMDTLL